MFGFLYEMLGGQHDTIGRRRGQPSVTYDAGAGAFVCDDGPDHLEKWPGRGETPGGTREAATTGLTVAEEMHELLAARKTP